MKYNDIEQYEVKSMLRKNQNDDEKNKGSKRRDSKSLDEIRKWVHNLAKDNRVRVNEHYSQVSRENRLSTEPEPTNLELPEEMRRIMMRRKEESLPPIKSERGTTATKRASILSSHSVVGVRPPELKLERLTLDGISFKASRSSTVRGRIQGRQAAIIPMKVTTDSFEVEREHMEKEREHVHKMEMKMKKDREDVSVLKDEEEEKDKQSEKEEEAPFEEIMKNPVKKITGDARTLERLAKLERMKAQFENKPGYSKRKKRSYIPSDVSKFTMSYLDINRLRKEVQTSRDKGPDRKYGFYTPIRGANASNISVTHRDMSSGAIDEEKTGPKQIQSVKSGTGLTSRNQETLDTPGREQSESTPRTHRFSIPRARSQLSLKSNGSSSPQSKSTLLDKPNNNPSPIPRPLLKQRSVPRHFTEIYGASSLRKSQGLSTSNSRIDAPHVHFEKPSQPKSLLIGNIL